MHLPAYVLAGLASWISLTAAAPGGPPPQPCRGPSCSQNTPSPPAPWGTTSSQCFTKMATSTGLWNTATTWSTISKPCTSTVTSTTTKTVTPAKSTSIKTVTSTATTTLSTSFSTITQTDTTTSTSDTTTVTSTTTTTTTTVTSSTSTSTVAAPATFTPIQTSLPGSTYNGIGGSDPISKRDPGPGRAPGRQNKPGSHGFTQWRHPQGVTCQLWVPGKCSTTTTTTTVTVTATATTVTSTSTSTTTTTSIPTGVTATTTTVTATTVSTITATSTSTSTSTTTTYLSTTTVYAACATNNFADEYLGEPLEEFVNGYTGVYDTTTDTAYDCCVAAITLGDTAIWAFIVSAGACEVGQTDGCPDPATNPSMGYYEPGVSPSLVAGNAYCGAVDSAAPLFGSSSSSS